MIKAWLLTGDAHGHVAQRLDSIHIELPPEEVAVIVLGDLGLNFWLNNSDKKNKKQVQERGYRVYALRGNHEERPENLDTMKKVFDEDVNNYVYMEDEFPNIHYLLDGREYMFGEHRALAIGGAYSVDKHFRLQRAAAAGQSFTGWFPDEQLTQEEMEQINEITKGQSYDFILSHTCPLRFQPTDLFLGCIDQSMVDNSMEVWMDKLVDDVDWGIWCFGHYHKDRIEAPSVEQFYVEVENIETVWNRWHGKKTFKDEWWLPLSPSMERWCEEEENNGNV